MNLTTASLTVSSVKLTEKIIKQIPNLSEFRDFVKSSFTRDSYIQNSKVLGHVLLDDIYVIFYTDGDNSNPHKIRIRRDYAYSDLEEIALRISKKSNKELLNKIRNALHYQVFLK